VVTNLGRNFRRSEDGQPAQFKLCGENKRRIDGQCDGGGSKNATNRVCGLIVWGVEERGEDTIVDGVKEADQDDDEGGGGV